MLVPYQKTYEGDDFTVATNGVLVFYLLKPGNIKKIRILHDQPNEDGATEYQIFHNDNGLADVTIPTNNVTGESVDLDIAGVLFDRIVVNLTSVGGGIVNAPIAFQIEIDETYELPAHNHDDRYYLISDVNDIIENFPTTLFFDTFGEFPETGDELGWLYLEREFNKTYRWNVGLEIYVRINEEQPPTLADLGGLPDTRTEIPCTQIDSPRTALANESGAIFTNQATLADMTFILDDSANCEPGKTRFTFCNLSGGNYRNQIQVDGSDHLYFHALGGAIDVTGGAVIVDSRLSGEFVTVLYLGNGIWITEAHAGNWI